MQQATQGDRASNYVRSQQQEPTATPTSPEWPCNLASESPSWTRTHNAPCASKSSVVSATTPQSAHARETRTAGTTRWPMSSSKPPLKHASELRRRRQGSCNRPDFDGLPQQGSLDRPADVWVPHGKDMAPEAWCFDFTSSPRPATRSPGPTTTSTHADYETIKRTFHDTANRCHQNGVRFIPCWWWEGETRHAPWSLGSPTAQHHLPSHSERHQSRTGSAHLFVSRAHVCYIVVLIVTYFLLVWVESQTPGMSSSGTLLESERATASSGTCHFSMILAPTCGSLVWPIYPSFAGCHGGLRGPRGHEVFVADEDAVA